MHEINDAMLLRATAQKKRSAEKDDELFLRVTHLQLMNKRIGPSISGLLAVENLKVLYLQEVYRTKPALTRPQHSLLPSPSSTSSSRTASRG
jgi:hypothetical protein